MGTREIELKLLMTAEAESVLRRDRSIHQRKLGRARSRSLFAVYFDTPDLDLKQAGAALRIRQEGRGRVQTLKAKVLKGASGGGAGLQTRVEFDVPTKASVPDLALIDDPVARKTVERLVGDRALQPVFITDIKRTIWDIAEGSSIIELALDRGTVRSGKQEIPVHEAELELKSGCVEDLLTFTKVLLQRVDFRVLDDTKAARGYRLFMGGMQQPVRARDAEFDATDSSWGALVAMVGEATGQLFANEAVVLDGSDPEGVHQARIAVRRSRALLSAFRPVLKDKPRRRLVKRLRWAQDALGPARDWDVFLTETFDPLVAAHPDDGRLKALRKRGRAARRDAYDQARATIHSVAYTKLQLGLIGFGFTNHPAARKIPAMEFARDLLADRLASVCDLAGDDPRALPEPDQHALRIELKKFRYAAEFFRPLHGRDAKPTISTTKKLQDCLGALNDAVVARGLVEQISKAGDPKDAAAVSLIEQTFAARVSDGLEHLNALWGKFQELEPYWEKSE